MTAVLRIETIGRCVAHVGERRIDPGAEIVFAALLYFALERGRKRSRSDVAELLWPGAPTNVQRARLRWLLSKLRSLGVPIDAGQEQLGLDSAIIRFDLTELAAFPLEQIGAIMPAYAPGFSKPFGQWVELQRDGMTASLLRHLLPQLSSAARADDWELVARIAEAIQRIDRFNEEAVLSLAEAQYRLGAKAHGLQTLERYLADVGNSRSELHLQVKLLEQRMRAIDGSIARTEPRFVGRVEQLRLMDGLLRSARESNGGALVLTGPAGIGKTRLLDEASLRASLAGMQVIRVKCQRGDRARPLSGIADLVPTLLELRGALGCDPQKLDRLRRLNQAGADTAEPASHVLASPEWLQAQLVDALLDLLDAVSEESPILIQIDDVQWVEQSLEWLWNSVISWSSSHSVAWLFAFRTSHKSTPRLEIPQVVVSGLEPDSADELVDDLLAGAEAGAAIDRSALLARGAGSPLFLRELVRHCINTGSTDRLPTTLVSLLDAGLAGLSKYALRTLQVAAILGKYATLDRIEAIARLPRPDFLDAISELELAAILSAGTSGATTGHVLWAEAAISRLTANVARLIHRHTAEQLEEELRNAPQANLVWECARHWENAGDLERARRATVTAAESLAQNGFPDDAAAAYSRAIQWAIDPRERLRLLDRHVELLSAAGRYVEIDDAVTSYDALAEEIDPSYDGHSDHEMRRWRADYCLNGDVRAQMENCFRCAQSLGATSRHRFRAARECAAAAELQSPRILKAMFEIANSLTPGSAEERWDLYLVNLLYHMRCGDVLVARESAKEQVDGARSRGDFQRLMCALGHAGQTHAITGEFDLAFAAQRERISLARQFGILDEARGAYDYVVALHLELGRLDAASEALEQMRAMTQTFGPRIRSGLFNLIVYLYSRQIAVMSDVSGMQDAVDMPHAQIARQPPRCRARILAIHLSEKLQAGLPDEVEMIARELRACFDEPDYWLDWPASIYAEYLGTRVGSAAAARFSNDFVYRIRREHYPAPTRLLELAEIAQKPLTFA